MLITNAKLFNPQYIFYKSSSEFESDTDIKFKVSKISDEYLPPDFIKPSNPSEVASSFTGTVDKAKIDINFLHADSDKITINSDITQEIRINRIYFPGWRYYINGKEVKPRLVNSIPYLTIKPGENIIELKFKNTPVRAAANYLTVAALLILIYIYGNKTIS